MADKPVYYWDACMFYEWLGKEDIAPLKRAAVDEILQENEKSENLIATSVITHLEVLPEKMNEKGASDEHDYLSLFDGKHFHEIELNTNIIKRAREIRDYYYRPQTAESSYRMMDLGDCIHLATASINSATEFHTRDNDRKGGKVPLLKLYQMYGENKLCGRYELKIVSPEAAQASLFDGQP